jgi:hypothetical protein
VEMEDLSCLGGSEMKDLESCMGTCELLFFLVRWVGLLTRGWCWFGFQRPTQISIKVMNTEEYTRDHSSGSAGSADMDMDVRNFSSSSRWVLCYGSLYEFYHHVPSFRTFLPYSMLMLTTYGFTGIPDGIPPRFGGLVGDLVPLAMC